MRPLLLLLAVATAAAATPPTRADAPDAAVPPPSAPTDAPPCSLAARLAARSDTSAFLELLQVRWRRESSPLASAHTRARDQPPLPPSSSQKRGLAHDLARTGLALTLFAPTNAALEVFDVLPPTAPGGGSVGALVSSAPAALSVITGGQFVRVVVPVAQLTRGRSLVGGVGGGGGEGVAGGRGCLGVGAQYKSNTHTATLLSACLSHSQN